MYIYGLNIIIHNIHVSYSYRIGHPEGRRTLLAPSSGRVCCGIRLAPAVGRRYWPVYVYGI